MANRVIKPDKEAIKRDFKALKEDTISAVKDKKRWIACFIELAVVVALIAVDMLTKQFIYGYCKTHQDIVIIEGIIRFTAVENTGASFGIFKDKTILLTIVSSICSILLLLFIFYSYPRRNKVLRASLALISAGALGNVIDRIALGYVRDMVYFELIDFAVFNFADSCLTIGTVLLIIYILFLFNKDEELTRKKREASLGIAASDKNGVTTPTADGIETTENGRNSDGGLTEEESADSETDIPQSEYARSGEDNVDRNKSEFDWDEGKNKADKDKSADGHGQETEKN